MPSPRFISTVFAVTVLLQLLASPARAADATLEPFLAPASELRTRALSDATAYDLLRSLTTEVGPRLAGSPGDARAVAWAVATMKRLGFANVRAEPVKVPKWVRGEASAQILAPWPQQLTAVALGGSVGSPAGGVEAEVVPVTSLDELKQRTAQDVTGRIVFFTGRMERSRDGSGYGKAVAARGRGAAEAARLGAVAMVMRSSGTSTARIAHTGSMRMEQGAPPIPALALSNTDADMLERQLASGLPVRLRLTSTARSEGEADSANVIGEIPGSSRRDELVVLGAHLDSWDLGTGAHDDGAGVVTVLAAAKLIGDLKQHPARTVRVVLYANEEFGLSGARAYAQTYAGSIDRHVLGLESDLGAFAPYGLAANVGSGQLPQVRTIQSVLEPLGIQYFGSEASGGADVGELRELGMPVMDIKTDAAPYFDLHHTANDTFDQVDPSLLARNVAAYAVVAYLGAQSPAGFGRLSTAAP